jgi:hypothetical protein
MLGTELQVKYRPIMARDLSIPPPSDTSVRPFLLDPMPKGDKRPRAAHNTGMSSGKTPRRLKTYAGAQGYVYQYYFVGQRDAFGTDPEAPSTEFVFDVTSDRKLTFAVSVFLPAKSTTGWALAHGRSLSESEQYAAAKLRLFRAFDEVEEMQAQGRRLVIDASGLEESLATLGVE